MIIRFWYCNAILLMVHLFRYFLSVLCSFIVEHMHANRWKIIPLKPRFLQCFVFVLIREYYKYYKVRRSIHTVLYWTKHYYWFEGWRLGFRAPESRKFPVIRCNDFFLPSKVRKCYINKKNEQLKLLCFAPFKPKKV